MNKIKPKQKKQTVNDRAREAIVEMATALHGIGKINAKEYKTYQKYKIPVVKIFSANKIKNLRMKNKISQSHLAILLNITVATVKKWEFGMSKPIGTALKLLNIVEKHGIDILC